MSCPAAYEYIFILLLLFILYIINQTTKAMSYELVCQSDFFVLGFQDNEEWMAIIRLLSTIVTISIISSFCNKWDDDRLLLFCAHWLRLVLFMGMVMGEVYSLVQHLILLSPANKSYWYK